MGRRILALAPHTDDAEWGCGASLSKWVENGDDVYHVAFSAAEDSIPEGYPKGITRQEFRASNHLLGIAESNHRVLDFPVRHFPEHRQEILEAMIELRSEIDPILVLCPSSYDTHQDHEVIFKEAFRAFKRSSILGWEMPWNNRTIELTYFEKLEKNHIEKKVQSLAHYESQLYRVPQYETLAHGLAVQRGMQISVPLAEAFETIRIISE